MLLDSNIIIYATKREHGDLRRFIAERLPAVSAVSVVEVLGYHHLTPQDQHDLEEFFRATTVFPISQEVIEHAVRLRQRKKMTLGDSLIAATALVHHRTLVTRNIKDFDWIDGLSLFNPFQP